MFSRPSHLPNKQLKLFPSALCALMVLMAGIFPPRGSAGAPQDTVRTIVSDDFVKSRPKGKTQRSSARKSARVGSESSSRRKYRLASQPLAVSTGSSPTLQLGLTIWKLRPANVRRSSVGQTPAEESGQPLDWIAERVEADSLFQDGDYLRLSIESPRAGYLYVIDRDWFIDGELGETKLIFPLNGDDNRVNAGRLIDIPADNQSPFMATPKANQAGEILTIMITSSPLTLPISDKPLTISNTQLMRWESMWRALAERFEMQGGAGQMRTRQEQQAAARKGTRQLTRDDPAPQTIYLLTPRTSGAFLLNVRLSYAK
jgi:hypothetical protein